jgi:hypothetical protein
MDRRLSRDWIGVFVAAGYLYVYGVRPLSVMGQTARGVVVGHAAQVRDADGHARATSAPRALVASDGRTVEFVGLEAIWPGCCPQ